MPSTAIDSQIHGFLFSTDEMREIFSDREFLRLDTVEERIRMVTRFLTLI